MKLKFEINTREHFAIMGFQESQFISESSYYTGEVKILTYTPEELLATKLRALYQRRKERDLYDLDMAIKTITNLDTSAIIHCFNQYVGKSITKLEFEANLKEKLKNKEFREDILPLLSKHHRDEFNPDFAYECILNTLINKI
jgi:predicted nucleotidyltransferase component of viral defense system